MRRRGTTTRRRKRRISAAGVVVAAAVMAVLVGAFAAGPALAGDLLVGSIDTDTVIRYDEATGAAVTVYSDPGIDEPTGIVIGPNETIYVASYFTHEVYSFSFDGTLNGVLIPAGSGGLAFPAGITIGPDGDLYVTSGGNGKVIKYNATTGAYLSDFITGLTEPTAIVFGPGGNAWVVAEATRRITKHDGSTGMLLQTINSSAYLFGPRDIVFGPNGNVYASSWAFDKVFKFDGATGALIGDISLSGSLDGASGLRFGPDGLLYVASENTSSVLRFDGTTGQFIDTFVPSGSGGLSGAGYIEFLPDPNQPPVADAGENQSVNEGAFVTLDGSASGDPDGDPIDYLWDQVAGPTLSLGTADPVHPTFTAPAVGPEGAILTFELATFDGELYSEPDFVNVTVKNVNQIPEADAGPDQIVNELTTVELDASASFDPDGESLEFTWVQTAGEMVTIIDPYEPVAQFTAPEVSGSPIVLEFTVLVDDGIDSDIDTVLVTVENVNHPPIADAGDTQAADEGTLVILDGTGSSDPDGDPLTYNWMQTGGPTVDLDLADPAHPSFVAPEVASGTVVLTFDLVVSDGLLSSPADTVAVAVRDVIAPPITDLAEARIVESNGSLSRDNVMWPPNHTMHEIAIIGVSDPQDFGVTITIDRVTQDEALNGDHDGNTDEDAVVNIDGVLLLRAERAGDGDGRVYVIEFTATNAEGVSAPGVVEIVVPKSRRKPAVDSGQTVTSW